MVKCIVLKCGIRTIYITHATEIQCEMTAHIYHFQVVFHGCVCTHVGMPLTSCA